MEFKILGRTRLQINGNQVDLGSAKQRGLLALLLFEVGRPVQMDRIVQVLWRDSTVNDVRGNLQALVSRLRKVLTGTGSGDALPKEGNAYRLSLDPMIIDYHQFRRLAEDGRAAASQGNHSLAKALLRSALSLWQGRPLEDLTGPWAEHCRNQMETFDRLPAYYTLFDSQLQLSENLEVMSETGRLTQDHELDETLAFQHMRSLNGLGKYPRALEFHSQFCERLFDAMGAEPGPELRNLRQDILRKQAGTGVTAPRRTAEPPPAPPEQLPPDAANFAGREDLLAWLDSLLEATGGKHGQVVALHGMPGVGKSRLATRWGNLRRDRFPDGQLFLDLRGYGPGTPMAPDDALGLLLAAMGVAARRTTATGDERRAELAKVLSQRRVLLVLDNALDSNQVRPLLAAVSGCFTIVTSRTRPWGLNIRDNAQVIGVPPLSSAESIELLRKEIGVRSDEDPAALHELATRSDGLPLGLRIIAQHVAHRPRSAIADMVDEFKDQEGLGILGSADDSDDENATLPVAFSWSYLALAPDTARAFRLLGLHPTTEFSTVAAGALLGWEKDAVDKSLKTLTRVNLLQYGAMRRYRLHDLLHGYAVDLVNHEESTQQWRASLKSLLDWYLATAGVAAQRLNPQHSCVPALADMTDVTPLAFDDAGEALAWFTRERANLIAAVPHAVRHGFHEHAWRLSANLHEVLDRLGHFEELLACHRHALKSARVLSHEEATSGTMSNIGMVLFRLRRYEESIYHLQASLDIASQLALPEIQANGVHNLASVHLARGDVRQAITIYERALELFRALGAQAGEASTLDQLANAYRRMERDDLALDYYHRALAIREDIGHLRGQGTTLTELGKLLHERGENSEALRHLEKALEVHRLSGDRTRTSEALVTISEVYYDLGSFDLAIARAEQAVDLGMDSEDQARAFHILGHAVAIQGDLDAARRHWREAVDLLNGTNAAETDVLLGHLDSLSQPGGPIPDPRTSPVNLHATPSKEVTRREA